jgi:hypothetical protein
MEEESARELAAVVADALLVNVGESAPPDDFIKSMKLFGLEPDWIASARKQTEQTPAPKKHQPARRASTQQQKNLLPAHQGVGKHGKP